MERIAFVAMAAITVAISSIIAPARAHAQDAPIHDFWNWPLDAYGRDAIAQDYAEYDACFKSCRHRSHLHHTGFDILAPKGTPVKAVADGFVVNLVLNDTGCKSDCTDHGDGNTLIIQHGRPFSSYQHLKDFRDDDALINQIKDLCAFYDKVDENGVHVAGWECTKTDNVVVKRGDIIGYVGVTGFGRNNRWRPHLYFQSSTFPTLYSYTCYNDISCCPKKNCFEYSGIHPFQAGYIDPVNDIEDTDGDVKVHVQVGPQGEGVTLRIGPDEQYDLQTRWHAADGTFWAIRQGAATLDCDQGWYKVMKVQHFPPPIDKYFDPSDATRLGAGTLPDTWVCIGNGYDQYVIPAK